MSISRNRRSHSGDRAYRLQCLKAFGLFVLGDMTLWQIAERLGIVEKNPATAASRARHRIGRGWEIIRASHQRWSRWKDCGWPADLSGARLSTYPPESPTPPALPPTPFEELIARLVSLESYARDHGFRDASDALRNMRVALLYNERAQEKKAASQR